MTTFREFWLELLEALGIRKPPPEPEPELEPLQVYARIDEIRPAQSYAELVAELDAGLGIELADDLDAITLKLPKALRYDQVQREQKRRRKWWRRG